MHLRVSLESSAEPMRRSALSPVPDPRLDRLTALFEPKKHMPATVTFADLAGSAAARSIIDLSTYRDADALLHVVRAFKADDIPHVLGNRRART